MADEESLGGLVGDDALLALCCCQRWCSKRCLWGNEGLAFLALSESSEASMVMYFSPAILMPFVMTPLGLVLSAKESAMALRSASET